MGYTNYPYGITSFGVPIYGGSGPIGIGMGDLRYLVTAKDNSNLYYKKLTDNGVLPADIYTDLGTAHAAMTADQNDVIAVTPGAHPVTAEVAWSKNFTHIVGLSGPTSFNDYSEAGCSIYTTTAAVAETVDLTGNHCQFYGMNFANNGADTGNLAAFNVDGYNAYFSGCSFHGVMNSTQDGVPAAAALYIDSNGSWYQFHNCVIGDNNWQVRADANSGQLAYVSTVGYPSPQHGLFKDCRFNVRSETAACCAVRLAHLYCMDGPHIFDRCSFHNVTTNWANALNQVFYNSNVQTATIILKDCLQTGWDEWQDSDFYKLYQSNMGVATVGGGICIEPTATIS